MDNPSHTPTKGRRIFGELLNGKAFFKRGNEGEVRMEDPVSQIRKWTFIEDESPPPSLKMIPNPWKYNRLAEGLASKYNILAQGLALMSSHALRGSRTSGAVVTMLAFKGKCHPKGGFWDFLKIGNRFKITHWRRNRREELPEELFRMALWTATKKR